MNVAGPWPNFPLINRSAAALSLHSKFCGHLFWEHAMLFSIVATQYQDLHLSRMIGGMPHWIARPTSNTCLISTLPRLSFAGQFQATCNGFPRIWYEPKKTRPRDDSHAKRKIKRSRSRIYGNVVKRDPVVRENVIIESSRVTSSAFCVMLFFSALISLVS